VIVCLSSVLKITEVADFFGKFLAIFLANFWQIFLANWVIVF
jgi:hypothetical protein